MIRKIKPTPRSQAPNDEVAGEMCSIIDGKREDAHLHEPILAAGDHEASLKVSRKVAKELGLSDAMIEKYLP